MDVHQYLKQKTLKTSSTVSQLLWNSLAKWSPHCPPVTGPCRRSEIITYICNHHKQSGPAPLNSALVMSNVGINAVQHCELKLQSVDAYALKYVFLHCSITDHSLIRLYLAHGPERKLLMNTPHDPSASLRAVLRQSCVMLQQCRTTNYESDIKGAGNYTQTIQCQCFSLNHSHSSLRFSLVKKKKSCTVLWPMYSFDLSR